MSSNALLVTAALTLAVAGGVYVTTRPGPVPETMPAAEHAHTRAHAPRYQCSMHPQIVSDRPGTCPICHMDLQLVAEEPAAAEPASDVPGHAPFTLSTERRQLIGVTTATVERRKLDLVIRTVGKVAYDPDLYQAIVEYREARRARSTLADSPWREAQRGADDIVRAAAVKLRRSGLSEQQVAGLAHDDRDPVNLLLGGDTVWVYARVYEHEVDLVAPGQEIVVGTPSQPDVTYRAKVAAVDPILDAQTRTARVRALVTAPGGLLRPETFVHAMIHVPLGDDRLALPEGAVLHTGEHAIVFVVRGSARERFEPRSVRLGREAEGYYELLDGVAEGEQVVTSANFLIDSESRFRAALAAFSGSGGTGSGAAAPGHVH
jgi:Cu(I)/Ag(I) efflux system membrane fusion protein